MSNFGYDAAPPSDLLPLPEDRERWEAHLEGGPGLDLLKIGDPVVLPENGLHVRGLIRPGFNGNVWVEPYQTATYKAPKSAYNQGELTLRSYGRFCMIYENPLHLVNEDPADRRLQDHTPLRFSDIEVVPLHNKGRLLVQKTTTDTRSDGTSGPIEPSRWMGSVYVERVVTKEEVRGLMAHMAIGMALTEPDVSTFAEQPFRKIVPLMSPYLL